ncbi:hypothetical protein TWF730_009873 [Orbilia blumenaviensis]|uniref:Uncharacterized protein n=1 Tax=Orbilia blumenaviensis TaxID=1796055 RepID=A0AAV9UWJ3_9PEZI
MPGSSRLIAVAVGSLLISSVFAGVVNKRDTQTLEESLVGSPYEYLLSIPLNPEPESARFRRYKRQDVPIDEGTVIATEETSSTEDHTDGPGGEVTETTEATVIEETSNPDGNTDPSNGGGPPPADGSGPPEGGLADVFADDAPPLMSDENGDPKEVATSTQELIASSRKELEGESTEMTQKELDDLATAVELISADIAKREDPATVDIDAQVQSEMNDWDSLSDAEKRETHEKSVYKGVTQGIEIEAVVGNLLGVAEKIVNGDVKTNVTEGLEGIRSEGVPSNSTDIPTGGGEPGIQKRSLEKRFILLPAVLSLLRVQVSGGIGGSINTPLGSLAVGLTTSIGKATNADPPKPQEKIVFYDRPTAPPEEQNFRQQQEQSFQGSESFRQQSFRQSQAPTVVMESQQPKAVVPGWDKTYEQNQGFRPNGFRQTQQSWKKSR